MNRPSERSTKSESGDAPPDTQGPADAREFIERRIQRELDRRQGRLREQIERFHQDEIADRQIAKRLIAGFFIAGLILSGVVVLFG